MRHILLIESATKDYQSYTIDDGLWKISSFTRWKCQANVNKMSVRVTKHILITITTNEYQNSSKLAKHENVHMQYTTTKYKQVFLNYKSKMYLISCSLPTPLLDH